MKPTPLSPHQRNLKVAEELETRILPKVQHAYRQELQREPYEGCSANEEILKAGIAFLRGENPHMSGFVSSMAYRWQGVEFVIWIKEIIADHVTGQNPAVAAKDALEWLTPFLIALLHHQDLPQEIV